ncbi:MAG: YdeI/OmpD-associated family protein [Sphingomonas sp.]|jgi:hypothetical protein|uniref:YdeI/OmpD-associated family protein n=1 Tax=Sphingomonas sp. TaxID=28214 RepID=UPI0035668DF8
MTTDPRITAYIAGRADFARPILEHLRARLHAVSPDIEETIKWGMPFFLHRGRPLANMAAFKAHASFGFWDRNGKESGPAGEGMGQFGRLTSLADLPDDAALDAAIREVLALREAGDHPRRAARRARPEAEVPPELAAALAADAVANDTFAAFPPSCRREYCEWIAEARRPQTRDKRVAEAIAWLREGKRRNWKYENC